ncbi:MAG TPA: TolC family protein [Gemmatimonadales bacterium]|nr:TolC family protein [Gemmatimonadales bacterium]
MLLLLLALAQPQDTVRLTHQALLDRAMVLPGRIAAADARATAAIDRLGVAGRLDNPILTVQAENLGMQEAVTGKRGLEGTEGQVILSLPLAIGGDRAARRDVASANRDVAMASRDVSVLEVRESVLMAMIDWERERALLGAAGAERDALETLADAMTARAREGRDASSDAALARLEAAAARSRHARQLAAASAANARLAAFLDLPAGRAIDLEPLACRARPDLTAFARPADLDALEASVRAAAASAALARAARVPDMHPQIGLRRSGGFSGVLVGLSLELPFLNTGAAAARAAAMDAQATEFDRTAFVRAFDGEVLALRRGLADLLAITGAHDSTWRADLETVVLAEERRLDVGEGSLYRLFDARRARLDALTEHETWRDAVRRHQVRLARLGVAPLSATLLCLPEDLP